MKKTLYLTMLLAVIFGWQNGVRAEGLDDLTLDENGVAQISSATDFLNFAKAVNSGNQGLNAVLTQDINLGTDEEGAEAGIMSELTLVGGILTNSTDMVEGRSPNKYTGTFDGQFHKITYVKTKADYSSWGLFGLLEGTIRNLSLKGTISTGKNFNAGLVNTINGGTVENCYVDVTISSGNTHGGICRVGKSAKGSLIKGCVFAGSLEGTGGNSNGFMYGEGTNNVVENSLILSFGAASSASYKFYRNKGTCKNCYYLDTLGTGANNPGSEAVTADELKTGSICYILNGGLTEQPAWRQTLGEDDLPVLDPAHKTVYTVGYYKCDGVTPVEGADISYTNDGSGKVLEDHQFVDGACTECFAIDPSYLKDGVFQISSAGSFRSFALIVNNGNTTLDAQLTEDIDLGGADGVPMVGFTGYSGVLISSTGAYAGTFDGGYHTITYNKIADHQSWGLFGCLSGTIKNLKLSGSLTTEYPYMSTLVNTLHGGTLRSCYSEVDIVDTAGAGFHGGFARVTTTAGGHVTGCWYAGNIMGEAAKACAGIVCFSENATRIRGALFTGQLNVDLSDGRCSVISRGNPSLTGCYYLQDTEAAAPSGVEQTTDDEMASGELTYKLNQGIGEFIFFQGKKSLSFQGDYVAKVAENGYGTFYVADADVEIPAGVEAYKGKIEGDVLQMTQIEGGVAAGTAVVLKGEPGYYCFTLSENPMMVEGNDLQGTAAPTVADGTQYILADVDGKVGFYQAQAQDQIPFAKAYLNISEAAGAKGFRMVFGDATGINEMTTDNSQQTTVICDLQGRRVVKATKGIYIVNGKKVLK